MDHKILRLNEVKELTGLSRSSIYKLISENAFPQQIKLSPRCVGWSDKEINEWISDKLGARTSSKSNGE